MSSTATLQKTEFLILQVWRALAAFIVMAGHVNNEALSVSKNTGIEYGYIRYPSAVGSIFFSSSVDLSSFMPVVSWQVAGEAGKILSPAASSASLRFTGSTQR
jgi:hypothetical protein